MTERFNLIVRTSINNDINPVCHPFNEGEISSVDHHLLLFRFSLW